MRRSTSHAWTVLVAAALAVVPSTGRATEPLPPDEGQVAAAAAPGPTIEELAARLAEAEAQLARLHSLPLDPPTASSTASPVLNGGEWAAPNTVMGGSESERELETPLDLPTPAIGSNPRSPVMPPIPLDLPLEANLTNGFELRTKDNQYSIQFHNLTQFDGRFYDQGHQSLIHDSFLFPRQWFIFSGRITQPVEYFTSIAQGFDVLTILDVFVNVRISDQLQFRVGRFKTPFTYEFYILPIQGLINPERSLFFNNFGLNRDLGAMTWGALFDQRVDYAVGVFNGSRNGFVDTNDSKDIAWLLNFRPFVHSSRDILRGFHFGGSMNYGEQLSPPVPRTLRTVVPTLGNQTVGIPFLRFNDDVKEKGERLLWSMHAAYFYRQLSLVAEWQSGVQSYALESDLNDRTALPIQSFYAQAGYFLTGEEVTFRGVVEPRRPLDVMRGKFGPGAWEIAARFNTLNIGKQIFTAGFADPELYTNDLYTVDLGVNWYWNRFIKVMFNWEHAEFGNPVLYRGDPSTGIDIRRQQNCDLFLGRIQLFF